jgi:eukaryotic-like serine/threonine-protein kinase
VTSRYFGETEELLSNYAWYDKNSNDGTRPVGTLKPNDLGLFDMQGNLYTWGQEGYNEYPTAREGEVVEDSEDKEVITSTRKRVMRGGAFGTNVSYVRSAVRFSLVPASRFNIGFRPARTLPLGPFTAVPPRGAVEMKVEK